METVFIGLGSNLGNRGENLRIAIGALAPHVVVRKKSSVYESRPQGVGAQPLYLNMVIAGETALLPLQLLGWLQKIEASLGRAENTHNLPRPIDLDIIFYSDAVIDLPELTIPHPRMHERAFVLAPLDEINSFHMHPKLQKPVIDMLDELGDYSRDAWLLADERL
jgi:2-amino-4-hydroxy-6-hydroxymethyldihydropteridine diphosphokinase